MPFRRVGYRWAITCAALVVAGLATLPGIADLRSQQRDEAFAAQLAALTAAVNTRIPTTWTLTIGPVTYVCSPTPTAGPQVAYRCVPSPVPSGSTPAS